MIIGSLLRLLRNNKIIPYDNDIDIDIGIMITNYNRLFSLSDHIKKRKEKQKIEEVYKI